MKNNIYHCPVKNITFPNDDFCGDSECVYACLSAMFCKKLPCLVCTKTRICPYWHYTKRELWREGKFGGLHWEYEYDEICCPKCKERYEFSNSFLQIDFFLVYNFCPNCGVQLSPPKEVQDGE
jgi:hypothetical protein